MLRGEGSGPRHGGAAWGPRDEFAAALRLTALTVASAGVFGLALWLWKGARAGQEFFAGYLVEQSLSVDNLFAFILIFEYFQVPPEHQARVLTWGIGGAVLMRGVMIVAGVAAVRRFKWSTLLFAAILLLSSIKLLMEGDDDDEEGTEEGATTKKENAVMRLSRLLVGATTEFDGDRFFTERAVGSRFGGPTRRVATPLLLTLVCVELSDVVFAVDSIPAVLGISNDPFVVYSSNIFAILGLRTLYTLVARAVDDLAYLKPAVCFVLVFISLKMIAEYFDYHVSTSLSLAVVFILLAGGVALSVVFKKGRKKKQKTQNKKHDPPSDPRASSSSTLGDDYDANGAYSAHADDALLHRRASGYSAISDLAKVQV